MRFPTCVLCLLWSLLVTSPASAQSIDGLWTGAITLTGVELKILVTFSTKGDSLTAMIDIPQQMALGLPLRNVRFAPPRLHFELPAGPGLALFDGTVAHDSARGDFLQSGIRGTFYLIRGGTQLPAPQKEPAAPPPPYNEEEVTFTNGAIRLAGTFTVPRTTGPHPAVVMLTGSGPQNRDEEIFGFKPFRIIADHLTRAGIAVLRYDDRGVGGSSIGPTQPTTEDFARDALAGIGFLKKRAEIDPRHIGLCGHSEGGIAAVIAASKSRDVAFLVLIACPAVSGERIVMEQVQTLNRAAGASEEDVERAVELQGRTFAVVHSGKGWDSLATELKAMLGHQMAAMSPPERAAIADSAAYVNGRIDAQMATVRGAWFKFFAEFDPVPALEKLSCPVLAIFGELDRQVSVSLNRPPMEDALKKSPARNYTIEVLPGANHLFQSAETGMPSEYAQLKKEFVPGFLNLISDWITTKVAVSTTR